MKRKAIKIFLSTSLLLFLSYCAPQERDLPGVDPSTLFYKPGKDLGVLFHDVQMSEIFPDSKTFVDCDPRFAPAEILERYIQEKNENSGTYKFIPPTK